MHLKVNFCLGKYKTLFHYLFSFRNYALNKFIKIGLNDISINNNKEIVNILNLIFYKLQLTLICFHDIDNMTLTGHVPSQRYRCT